MVVISKFFANFFHCHKFQKLSNYRRGKIQLYATHWTPISNMSMPSQWFLPIHIVREGYKLHSLLGSVGKGAETNFNFPSPPFNHTSGICKNLADTWPAATRVLSRGRKRGDPGNEVVSNRWVIEGQKFCGLSIIHRWPIDYSATIIPCKKDTFLAFLCHFVFFYLWFFFLC